MANALQLLLVARIFLIAQAIDLSWLILLLISYCSLHVNSKMASTSKVITSSKVTKRSRTSIGENVDFIANIHSTPKSRKTKRTRQNTGILISFAAPFVDFAILLHPFNSLN